MVASAMVSLAQGVGFPLATGHWPLATGHWPLAIPGLPVGPVLPASFRTFITLSSRSEEDG